MMRIALDRLALLVDWFRMARGLGSHFVLLSAAGEPVRHFKRGYDVGGRVLRSIACMNLSTVEFI